MDIMKIAEGGVSILGAPRSALGEDGSSTSPKPLQAMRLELDAGVLDNIIRSARSGGKGVHMSFGKTIVSGPFVEPKPLNFYSEPFPDTRLRKQIQTAMCNSPRKPDRGLQLYR